MSAGELRIGLKVTQQIHPIAVQREVWKMAEDAGFDHLWAFDHLCAVGAGTDPTLPIFDGWTVLAAMAVDTRRIHIGLNVTGNLYRHPGLLAKIAVTVDHLSGGRLEFGIGAAWTEAEFTMMGLPFPSAARRIGMLDEACSVLKALWTEESTSFSGRFYRLDAAIAEPKPLQRPHPPIWIGGAGPRLTLRVVARHADVWNAQGPTVDAVIASNAILDRHCAAVDRDPATIRRSVGIRMAEPDEMLRAAERYAQAGFSDLLLYVGPMDPADDPRRDTEQLARSVLPRMREVRG